MRRERQIRTTLKKVCLLCKVSLPYDNAGTHLFSYVHVHDLAFEPLCHYTKLRMDASTRTSHKGEGARVWTCLRPYKDVSSGREDACLDASARPDKGVSSEGEGARLNASARPDEEVSPRGECACLDPFAP